MPNAGKDAFTIMSFKPPLAFSFLESKMFWLFFLVLMDYDLQFLIFKSKRDKVTLQLMHNISSLLKECGVIFKHFCILLMLEEEAITIHSHCNPKKTFLRGMRVL